MSSEFSSIRVKDKLEIAVSTDTVLYLPFYISYYNNDFRDTPFADLEVVIIGTKNDFRFKKNIKLKGDGFATFTVLLGLADAAICDPSFFIYLSHCDDEPLKIQLQKFQDLLEFATKKDIVRGFDRKQDSVLTECFEVNERSELIFRNIKTFKEKILKKHAKVIGGMVSKMAFLAIGSEDLIAKDSENTEKSLGRLYTSQNSPSNFGKANITKSFFHYDTHSTGYCIGYIYADKYARESATITTIKGEKTDFGFELRRLSKKSFAKNQTAWIEIENTNCIQNSVSFSCDFISIDFLLDKHNGEASKRVIELEDLAYDSERNFMFTGIIGNNKPENSEKLKGLLYGIDKTLYKIHSYLQKSDTTGLIQFLKAQLKYDEDTQDMLLELLIADENLKECIKDQINDKATPYSFENVLKYYVDRLREWKQVGNLYYSKTDPVEAHLKELTRLRYRTLSKSSDAEGIIYKDFIAADLLSEYRKKEEQYFSLERKSMYSKNIKLWTIFSPVLLVAFLWRFIKKVFNIKIQNDRFERFFLPIEAALWSFIRKPILLYLAGSIFILLEITSSMFHIFHPTTPALHEMKFEFITVDVVSNTNPEVLQEIRHSIYYGNYLFIIFFVYLITIFFSSRKLLQLKQESKYFYRNE
jgi:hypothetical protein